MRQNSLMETLGATLDFKGLPASRETAPKGKGFGAPCDIESGLRGRIGRKRPAKDIPRTTNSGILASPKLITKFGY